MTHRVAAAPEEVLSVASRAKPRGSAVVTVAAPPPARAPLVIAQAEASDVAAPATSAAPASDSLLARTIGIKDHVVHATLHAVSVIGGIPNWVAAIGDRISTGNSTGETRRLSTSS